MRLRVVTPAATFPEALSLVQEQKAELGVTACCKACEDPRLMLGARKLFPRDVISLISLTYVIFVLLLSEFLFDSWFPSFKHCSLPLMHEITAPLCSGRWCFLVLELFSPVNSHKWLPSFVWLCRAQGNQWRPQPLQSRWKGGEIYHAFDIITFIIVSKMKQNLDVSVLDQFYNTNAIWGFYCPSAHVTLFFAF